MGGGETLVEQWCGEIRQRIRPVLRLGHGDEHGSNSTRVIEGQDLLGSERKGSLSGETGEDYGPRIWRGL